MEYLKEVMIGVVVGGGLILPGVSGAVLAVIFGVYEKMINAVGHFFKDWKKNTIFLLPLIFGILIGVFIFGSILNFVFDKYPMQAKLTFIGLILGGVPVLFYKIREKGTKKISLVAFFSALFIACLLFVLGKTVINTNFSSNLNGGIIEFVTLFFTGLVYVSGKIVPGISGSFLLMLIGMYEYVLHVISSFFALSWSEYIELIPLALGMLIGGIILIKIIQFLLDRFYNITYSAITGFVLGSLPNIYPGIRFDMDSLIGVILLLVAFYISYQFSIHRLKIIKDE